MIVVSDTSPILNLARIGRLELLPSLYHHVLIPSAVYTELATALPGFVNVDSSRWLTVAAARDQHEMQVLGKALDPGEAEAIALAIERRADLLLVDEKRARRTAAASGLRVTGLIGVVAKAKQAGLIDLAKPVLDELIQVARFWIGPKLYAEVLKELRE